MEGSTYWPVQENFCTSPGGALPDEKGLFHTSTPTAVALSFTTTMIGFGGLLFAQHRGLASLGGVMVLGSLMGMLACLLVLPRSETDGTQMNADFQDFFGKQET